MPQKKHNSWHHRKPRSLGGTRQKGNMSKVSSSKHEAWHTLFQNYTPEKIAQIINDVWLDPDFKLVVERR